jgi:hypothetical protein
VLLFVWLEGGFYHFVPYLLGFFFFDYGCVHVGFLQGIDFLEDGWFFVFAAYDGYRLWLVQNV